MYKENTLSNKIEKALSISCMAIFVIFLLMCLIFIGQIMFFDKRPFPKEPLNESKLNACVKECLNKEKTND